MKVAVVDPLVHHATIFEMNVESYRRRAALERKRGHTTPRYDEAAAKEAWQRTLDWFNKYLRT